MSVKKIWGSRARVDANTYVGDHGTLFYDESTGEIRLSNGVTPGGVAIAVRADVITAQSLLPAIDNNDLYDLGSEAQRWHHLYIGDGGIKFDSTTYPYSQTTPYIPGGITESLIPVPTNNSLNLGSTSHRWGSVYLGPDSVHLQDKTTLMDISMTVDNGTIYFNGVQNLLVGVMIIEGSTLRTTVAGTNINIGDPADTGLATIGRRTVITTANLGSGTAALLINGATTLPDDPSELTFDGTLIHTVAQVGQSARIVQDAFGAGNYPIYVGRMARGTIATPTAASTGDILLRISANGYSNTGFTAGASARIDFVADELFSSTGRGSQIDFWTTPIGSTTVSNSASVSSDGFVGAGVRFTTDNTYQTTRGIPYGEKAIASANYVATLGSDGKLDSSQIPTSLSGAVVFKGSWDANTNTPALSDSTPAGVTAGWEYVVGVAGTRNIGDGNTAFLVGDFVIYDGAHWKHISATSNFSYATSVIGSHTFINNNQGTQETSIISISTDATPNAVVGAIVSRDATGNFSANTISANLTGSVSGSVSGNAGTVTNGVYTTGDQTIGSTKTFANTIIGSVSGNAGTVTNGVYTTQSSVVTNTMLVNRSVTVNGTTIALGGTGSINAAAGTLTGTTLNSFVVNSSLTSIGTLTALTVVGTGAFTTITGNYVRNYRDAGVIADGGTVNINFSTDAVIFCQWDNNFTVTYSNYTIGSVVKLMSFKRTGTGTDSYSLGGVTPGNVSTGSTTVSGSAGQVNFVEFVCIGATISTIFAKI